MTIKPADESITEDDAFIAGALESANIPTLMMTLVHLTGDTSILDGRIQPHVSMLTLDGALSEEAKVIVSDIPTTASWLATDRASRSEFRECTGASDTVVS